MSIYKTIDDIYKFSLNYVLYTNDLEQISANTYNYLFYKMKSILKKRYISYLELEEKQEKYKKRVQKELKKADFTQYEIDELFISYDILVENAVYMGKKEEERYAIETEIIKKDLI